jgi:hypothetical protein
VSIFGCDGCKSDGLGDIGVVDHTPVFFAVDSIEDLLPGPIIEECCFLQRVFVEIERLRGIKKVNRKSTDDEAE